MTHQMSLLSAFPETSFPALFTFPWQAEHSQQDIHNFLNLDSPLLRSCCISSSCPRSFLHNQPDNTSSAEPEEGPGPSSPVVFMSSSCCRVCTWSNNLDSAQTLPCRASKTHSRQDECNLCFLLPRSPPIQGNWEQELGSALKSFW